MVRYQSSAVISDVLGGWGRGMGCTVPDECQLVKDDMFFKGSIHCLLCVIVFRGRAGVITRALCY